jgi:hypothetical protein
MSRNEFLDDPDCDPTLAAASYRFMETVNRRFGGVRVVRRFLAAETAGRFSRVPLRILDIGSGSCDIPLSLVRWARALGIPLHFTCLEIAEPAMEIARGRLAGEDCSNVKLVRGDAFTHTPSEPYDCAVASMCFHHFSNAQIITLLQRLRGFVLKSVLINDLRRSWSASLAARLLSAATAAPPGVRHDALLSVGRGFKTSELGALLRRLEGATASVKPVPWFRIAATIRFEPGR